jgi:hypothetical protein
VLIETFVHPVGVHHSQTLYKAVVFSHEERVDRSEGWLFTGSAISCDINNAANMMDTAFLDVAPFVYLR